MAYNSSMLLKEIFSKRKDIYDPVHAHVPGVNEEYRRQLLEEHINGGDPIPRSEPPREEIISIFPGIKLVRTTRSN